MGKTDSEHGQALIEMDSPGSSYHTMDHVDQEPSTQAENRSNDSPADDTTVQGSGQRKSCIISVAWIVYFLISLASLGIHVTDSYLFLKYTRFRRQFHLDIGSFICLNFQVVAVNLFAIFIFLRNYCFRCYSCDTGCCKYLRLFEMDTVRSHTKIFFQRFQEILKCAVVLVINIILIILGLKLFSMTKCQSNWQKFVILIKPVSIFLCYCPFWCLVYIQRVQMQQQLQEALSMIQAIASSIEPPREIEEAPEAVAPEAGAPEALAPEAGAPEAGAPEAGAPEAGAPEALAPEAGAPEALAPEAGAPEAGAPEALAPEAGAPEALAPEAGAPEALAPVAGAPEARPRDRPVNKTMWQEIEDTYSEYESLTFTGYWMVFIILTMTFHTLCCGILFLCRIIISSPRTKDWILQVKLLLENLMFFFIPYWALNWFNLDYLWKDFRRDLMRFWRR